VANPALPGGQLRWQEQGVQALIADGKHPEMVQTPMLSAAESQTQRVGTLSLQEDGTLEGDIREIRFGNAASEWRERNRFRNDAEREEELKDELKRRFADFSVSRIKFAVPPDVSIPVGLTYHVVVPGYAQRTGKRLIVRVNYFGSSFGSQLPQGTRHNHIYFDYPWSELDTVDLKIPAGFELDHADAPANITAPPTCTYVVRMSFTKSKNTLSYSRQLTFGDKGLLLFDKRSYPDMKTLFEGIHASDEHMVTLKAQDVASSLPSQQ
jgi:hypothetical protein